MKNPTSPKLQNALNKEFSTGELLSQILWRFFRRLVIIGLTLVCIQYLMRDFGNNEQFGGNMKFEIKTAKDIEQRLSDVKGIDEISEEVKNIIKLVKNPDKYREKGAKLHKGVLLFGEPGTGKTLLARAIAGEAGVNFIFCSGSDFDEMFVGVGAKRIR